MVTKGRIIGVFAILLTGMVLGSGATYLYLLERTDRYISNVAGPRDTLVWDWDHVETLEIEIPNSNGLVVMNGVLHSKTSGSLKDLTLIADFYDGNGEIVTSCIDRVEGRLGPGESLPFQIQCRNLSLAAYKSLALDYEIGYMGVLYDAARP
jgi:hypothetical protein